MSGRPLSAVEGGPWVHLADDQVRPDFPLGCFSPEIGEASPSVRVIFVANLDGKNLICVPADCWHRTVARRALPQRSLQKAIAVEVAACLPGAREVDLEGESLKVWLGFMPEEFSSLVVVSTREDVVDYDFHEEMLPFAEALVQVSKDHYEFFSPGEETEPPPQEQRRAEGSGSPDLNARMSALEDTLADVSSKLATLVGGKETRVKKDAPTPKLGVRPKPKATQKREAEPAPELEFPDLDSGVVAAALAAGVPRANLEQMQKLMGSNVKAAKALKQVPKMSVANVLSEEEEEEEEQDVQQRDSGLADPPGSPVEKAIAKLSVIVEHLAENKKKSKSKLEAALDGVSSASAEGSGLSIGKRSAAARRALRQTFTENPEDIFAMIERQMQEDILSQTVGPGLQDHAWSARGWMEHRSKIGPYKAVAHCGWGVAGIIDCHRFSSSRPSQCRQSKSQSTTTADRSILCGQGPMDIGNGAISGRSSTFWHSSSEVKQLDGRKRDGASLLPIARHTVERDSHCTSSRSGRLSGKKETVGEVSTWGRRNSIPPRRRRESSSHTTTKGKGEAEGCFGGSVTAMSQDFAWEKSANGGDLPGAKLPGDTASTIALSSLVNSMPRWILKTPGSLRSFLLSILKKPLDNEVYTSGRDGGDPSGFRLWPIPVPYPEAFTKKGTSACSWKQRLVNLQVIVLSWLHLGCPYGAPPELRLGRRLSFRQWSVIKMMHRLDYDGNLPLLITAADMGRAAGKFECLEDTLAALCSAVAGLHVENGGYYGEKLTKPGSFTDDWMRCGNIVGHLNRAPATTAKQIVSSRLSFPSEPKFDPVPFFDVAAAQAFCFPLQGAKDHREDHGEIPRVKVNATHEEKLLLFKKLADTNRLKPVSSESLRPPYWSGLFSVGKDAARDRLILDARPPNKLETVKTAWCQSMAYGPSLCDLVLRDDATLVSSGLDLRDFFYQFRIGAERLARNILAGPVSLKDARKVFGDDFQWPEDPVWLGLATLAMGDLNACEFSQASHLSMMLKSGVVKPHELWTLRNPPPRTLTTVGIIIDDLVIMEQVLSASINDEETGSESERRIRKASLAYEEAGLETNCKKSFLKEPLASFWGIEVDGSSGTIRSSSKRLWPLMAVTFRTARLGFASVKLIEMLAGSWISVLSCRRRMFCLMDVIFEPLGIDNPGGIIRLSEALRDELMTLAVLGPLASSDLRAQFLPFITATDASLDWMAAVRAHVDQQTVQEFARYSLKKSTWSRLLPPGKAWLRSHAMLDEEDEMPEEGFQSHPLYDLVARCYDYKERWRHPCRHGQHINILELKAFLFEEKKICQAALGRRSLCGLDSQVCLGALVKGRSSSPSLNRLMRSSLCYPLGSGVYSYFMYFATQHNRADGPTRGSLPAPSDLLEPAFLKKLSSGDVSAFECWMNGLEHPDSPQLLNYDGLLNGTELDLRPSSQVTKAEKRKNVQFLPCRPLPSFDEVKEDSSCELCEEAIAILRSFNPNQFYFDKDVKAFNRPGGLIFFLDALVWQRPWCGMELHGF